MAKVMTRQANPQAPSESDVPIQLLVGLGNPGDEYAKTRHNAGAWLLESMAKGAWKMESRLHASLQSFDAQLRLMIPTTYMNDSGRAVQAVMRFYKIPVEAVMVVHDEIDFDLGRVKMKFGGGHGGHNGIRDIMQCVGPNFWRLRLGIGHPGHRDRVHGYVLSMPSVKEREAIDLAIHEAKAVMPLCCEGHFHTAMQQLH